MSSTKYLTQFICTCDRCGRETMAIEIDGDVTVECNGCDIGTTFSRRRTRLSASILRGRLEGNFGVADRFGS